MLILRRCSPTSIADDSRAGSCCRRWASPSPSAPRPRSRRASAAAPAPGTPECDPTPAKLPFEPTGWKTVLLDHFSCQVGGLPEGSRLLRRADELEDPQRRRQAGGARHRRLGRSRPPRRISGAAGAAGSAGGRPGGARAAAAVAAAHRARRASRRSTVSAGASSRGTRRRWKPSCGSAGSTPVADNQGKDFQSFHVKDPDGFDLQISNGSRKNRRQGAGERQDVRAGAVRRDQLEDGLARSHLVRGLELQGDGGVLHGAARLEAGHRRGQPESVRDRRHRRHHHPSRRRRQPRRRAGDDAAGAARGDGSHLVRHHAVRSGCR